MPAIVRETQDHDLLRDALLENLHRAQLNPLEEAAAYQQMLEDFGCTQEELAARIKRSRPQISNTIRLLKLPPTVQRRVAAGVLSAGHARAISWSTTPPARSGSPSGSWPRASRSGRRGTRRAWGDRRESRPTPGAGGRPRGRGTAGAAVGPLRDPGAGRLGRAKGKITIDFATIDDLERIAQVISSS